MKILHDSPDLLVIHSSARKRKIIFALMAALGGLLGVAALASAVTELITGKAIDDAVLSAGCVASGALMVAGFGTLGLFFARDADYHFYGKDQRLIVRWQNGQRAIPFARIVKAKAEDYGSDSFAYMLELKLRNPPEEMILTKQSHCNDAALKPLADKINHFLKAHKDEPEGVSIDLADAGLGTMAKEVLTNLWHGPSAKPPAPVVREEPVLFVCPQCGLQTNYPKGPPPYECERCQAAGEQVFLQDRTPGRTIVVPCGCGISFSVPVSFAGTKRPCPQCARKCRVPPAPAAPASAIDNERSNPADTSFREENA
jgi:hypothetical protein